MNFLNLLFAFVTLLFCTGSLQAQGFDPTVEAYDTVGYKNRKTLAATSIRELKEGVLLVRLTTNQRKLQELGKLSNNPELKASDREKFAKMAESLKSETRQQNQWLMEAFAEQYLFSRVLFLYDTSIQALKNGVRKGIFLDANLQPDASLALEHENWLMAYYGEPLSGGKTSVEGLVISDRRFEILPDPFPSFVGVPAIRRVLASFSGKDSDKDVYLNLTERLNKRFVKFLQKVERK